MKAEAQLLVLISGRGSNLKSLIENCRKYRVSAVISSNKEGAGVQVAAAAGIPTYCFDRKDFPNLAQQKSAIFDKARELKPDFVALAGFMLLAQEEFVNHFSGRMINIHPALLPAYAGLNTHRRVLEAGEKKHGCSVHFVDCGVDTGALIAQAALDVIPGESESELASRVLTLEHKLYPWVANNLASGEIKLTNNLVSFADNLRLQATKLGFTLGDSI